MHRFRIPQLLFIGIALYFILLLNEEPENGHDLSEENDMKKILTTILSAALLGVFAQGEDAEALYKKAEGFADREDYVSANQDNILHALREKGYFAYCESPYPLGWLDLKFTPDGMFRHYRRGVNMRTGEAFVEFTVNGCRYRRDMFVSRDSDISVIRMSAEKPFTTTYDFRLFEETGSWETTKNRIIRTAHNGKSAANLQFIGEFASEVSEKKLVVTGQEYMILIRCSSNGSSAEIPKFCGETYNSLLKKHTALHTPLYDAVTIELEEDTAFAVSNERMLEEAYDDVASPALLERLWRFGRYLFISAAAKDGNPVPLYGLWHGDDHLQWCQYVANENVEMTYWHTMAGGLSYAIPTLLHYYTDKIDKFRECARQVFGMKGIWISAYTTPHSAGLCVPVAVISNWIGCAGWLCRHFWEYYVYTGDEKLLREEILPFMYEAALFLREYTVIENGVTRLYPSVSPENTPKNLFDLPTQSATGHRCPAVQNATMDFAIMKELLTNLLDGIEITGLYIEEAPSFRELLEKIPPYFINREGAVQEWMHPNLEDNYAHRHLSHIYPVFPGMEVTAQNDPSLFEAFRKAVDLRKLGSQSNWSLTHMAGIYARFGEGEKAAECLDIMAKSVLLDSLFTIANDWRGMGITLPWGNPPVQLDAVFGTVNAIQEMIFCRQKDALSILPALPKKLHAGSVRGMVFPEGKIDIAWNIPEQVEVTVHAHRTLDTDILLAGKKMCHIHLAAGEKKTIPFR